ncbi:MAG: ABC transporter ATP-binding protein [Pseudomonadota bacterium]
MMRKLLTVAGQSAQAPLKRNFAGLFAEAVLIGIGFALLVPFLRAFLGGDIELAWRWLGVIAGLLIIYALVRYWTQMTGYRAAIALARILFSQLGTHISRLPLGWFVSGRVGQLARMTSKGVIDVMGVPAHLLRPVVAGIVTPATVVALMFVFDWRLALAALLTAPVAALVYRWSGSLVQTTDHRVDAAAADAADRIVEFAQAQAVLRAFRRGEASLGKLDQSLVEQRHAARNQIFTAARGIASFILVVQAGFTIVLLYGFNLALGGEIDPAEFIVLLVLAVRYVEPLIIAADLEGALRISRNSLDRMDRLLATPSLPEPRSPKEPDGVEIVFDDVDFAYEKKPVLKKVGFIAPERGMTAIVGPSGSGKTTILRLIARFWDVNSGAVRIGGIDVRDLATEDLMGMISVVFQDVYLFDGTIAENIRLGRPGASDAELLEAARLARVDEIAEKLPDGLSARVGEGGAALSGGERQRVSIARAILKDAPIVLLDEATAALDPINDAAVQEALQALTDKKTLIVVAHRLQTIQSADRILVLEGGQIVETGNHADLLSADGRYAAFWHERNRAAGWRLQDTPQPALQPEP